MDNELIAIVTIDRYIRKIQVSKSRRATYYFQGETLPYKYQSQLGANYQWVNSIEFDRTVLCDGYGNVVIKNKNSAGTPKYKIINGQDLHTLQMKDYERSAIVKAIKEQMIPEVEKLDIIAKFPLRILCELYDTVIDVELGKNGHLPWDIDNRAAWYCKVFQDVLCGCPYKKKKGEKVEYRSKRIIPDDDRLHITQSPSPLFYPIENSENRKLVFKIYHDKRDIISNSKGYVKKEV